MRDSEFYVQLTNTLICSDAPSVMKLLSEQIRSRIVVVPVADPPPQAGELVEFTIRVEIGAGAEVSGRGRVVQFIGADGVGVQAVLQIEDSALVVAALEQAVK